MRAKTEFESEIAVAEVIDCISPLRRSEPAEALALKSLVVAVVVTEHQSSGRV